MTHGSLFSGIGGFDYAAGMMGWRNAFHCEINEFCSTILNYHFPDAEHYRDITKTDFNKWGGASTCSQADSLASLFPLPEQERERMMTVTFGRRCYVPYGKSDPLGSLVRTLLESSRWYSPARRLKWETKPLFSERITEKEYGYGRNMSSRPSAEILSVKDIPSSRLLFRLVPSERPTDGTGCGLLPTLQTQGLKVCNAEGKTEFMPLELLPTPTAIDSGSGRVNKSLSLGAKERPTIALAVKMGLLPSPVASDATTGAIIGENDTFVTTGNGTLRKVNRNGTNGSIGLARMVKLLPTPNAAEGEKYTKKYNPDSQMGKSLTAMAMNGFLPTPTAMDFKGTVSTEKLNRKDGKMRTDNLKNIPAVIGTHCRQRDGVTSQLSPLFVAEMMGFPSDWTVLPFQSGEPNR